MDLFGNAPVRRHLATTLLDESHATWYAGATGDFHPAHAHRAQAEPLGGRVAPPALLAAFAEALALEVVGPGAAVVGLEATWRDRARLGETLETSLVLESATRARVAWRADGRDLGEGTLTLAGGEA
ncbi:MAG TPA: hypothetical protein VM889_08665 [Candidatus Thermoplasmatota archaeon]|nr:hypothetical protein [Candidatus Thermoplasmatota archaeon]